MRPIFTLYTCTMAKKGSLYWAWRCHTPAKNELQMTPGWGAHSDSWHSKLPKISWFLANFQAQLPSWFLFEGAQFQPLCPPSQLTHVLGLASPLQSQRGCPTSYFPAHFSGLTLRPPPLEGVSDIALPTSRGEVGKEEFRNFWTYDTKGQISTQWYIFKWRHSPRTNTRMQI